MDERGRAQQEKRAKLESDPSLTVRGPVSAQNAPSRPKYAPPGTISAVGRAAP
jgi:hypothetical protein